MQILPYILFSLVFQSCSFNETMQEAKVVRAYNRPMSIPHRKVVPDTGTFELGPAKTVLLYGGEALHRGGTQILNRKVVVGTHEISITTNKDLPNMQFRTVYLKPILEIVSTFPDSINPIAQQIKIETPEGCFNVYRQVVWNCNPIPPHQAHSHICQPNMIRYFSTQWGVLAELEIDRQMNELLLESGGAKVPYPLMEEIIRREKVPDNYAKAYLSLLK